MYPQHQKYNIAWKPLLLISGHRTYGLILYFPPNTSVYTRINRLNIMKKTIMFPLITPGNWAQGGTIYQPDEAFWHTLSHIRFFQPFSHKIQLYKLKMTIVFTWTAETCHFIAVVWCFITIPCLWHSMAGSWQPLVSIISNMALLCIFLQKNPFTLETIV